jgi:hypothetical protein
MKNHQESKKQLEVVQIYLSFHSFKTQFGNESLQKSDEIKEGFTILGILDSSPAGARVPGFGVFEHETGPSGARVPDFGVFEHGKALPVHESLFLICTPKVGHRLKVNEKE